MAREFNIRTLVGTHDIDDLQYEVTTVWKDLLQKFSYSELEDSDDLQLAINDANIECRDDAGTTITAFADIIPSGGGGGGENLAATLAIGNTTGGTGIVLTSGDTVDFSVGSGGTLNSESTASARSWLLPDAAGTIPVAEGWNAVVYAPAGPQDGFVIAWDDLNSEYTLAEPSEGTVTSIETSGTVNGVTLTGGPITSTGTITLGGTLSINNDDWSGADLAISNGGTGASSAQAAINALSDVSSATDEHVLTKDTASGDAVWKTIPQPTTVPLPTISLSNATDNVDSFNRTSTLTVEWDVENFKDATVFSHSNVTNPEIITVLDTATYLISGGLRSRSGSQRVQALVKILVNGSAIPQLLGSGYIRNNGASSDYWTSPISAIPLELTANDEITITIEQEPDSSSNYTSFLYGTESYLSIIKLESQAGPQGATGATGAGANIIVQEDDVTVGTVTSTLNFEGGATSTDEGAGKTTIRTEKQYVQRDFTGSVGGDVNAAYDSLTTCVPDSGTFEITVARTGNYIIYASVVIGTDLNEDDSAIQILYSIDNVFPASENARQAQQAKKNKRNGVQGTWADVSLTAGEVIRVGITTLGDNAGWNHGELWIAAWN